MLIERSFLLIMEKLGYTFQVIDPYHNKELLAELKEVSDQWLSSKKEMTFSVGTFDKTYLQSAAIGILRNNNQELVGFASIMPTYTEKTISIDLIRWCEDEDIAMMDVLYLQTILWAKESGYQYFNLGMAPFSSSFKNTIDWENTFVHSVYRHTQHLYSFKGLRKYKEKYKPKWSSKYIVYNNETSLLKNLYSCYRLINSK